jgi:hypothetical protein
MSSNRAAARSLGTSRRKLAVVLVALFSASILWLSHSFAQARDTQVYRAAQCDGCRIELEHVVAIGSPDDEHLYGMFSSLVRRPGSSYYVAESYTPGVVLAYDSTGSFTRTIGRLGTGPGEIGRYAHIAVTPEDTLLVVSNGRVTVFSTTDGRAIRSWTYHEPIEGISALGGGLTFASLRANERQETARIFNADGSSRASVFFDDLLQHAYQLEQRACRAGDDRLIVADGTRYRLRAFDTDGQLQWTVQRDVDWFPPYTRQPPRSAIATPSLPAVICAWLESDRYLWVLLERAPEDWRPVEGAPATRDLDFNTIFGSHLEVMDLETRKVLASRRTDWLLPLEGDEPFVYSVRHAEAGHVVFDVWQVKLSQPSRGRQ